MVIQGIQDSFGQKGLNFIGEKSFIVMIIATVKSSKGRLVS